MEDNGAIREYSTSGVSTFLHHTELGEAIKQITFERKTYLGVVKVYGLRNKEYLLENVQGLQIGDWVTLYRKYNSESPDCTAVASAFPDDGSSIRVHTLAGLCLGYIQPPERYVMAELMKAGKHLYAKVHSLNMDMPMEELNTQKAVTLDLYWMEESKPLNLANTFEIGETKGEVMEENGKARAVIDKKDLEEANPYSNYTSGGKVREQERDVVKYWRKSELRLATIGFENQTDCDKDMPLRIMNYDGAAYRKQFSPHNDNPRYPVVSIVLYYGYKHHWNGPRMLRECLEVPEELDRYVGDYPMNVFDIAYLEDEQLNKFESDFKVVADYFVQMRKTGNYIPPTDEIIHVQEVLSLMSALTNDNRFVESYDEVKKEKKVNMCVVLDKIEEKGIEKGIEVGKITARFEDGMPIEMIAEKTNVSVQVVNEVLREAGMID